MTSPPAIPRAAAEVTPGWLTWALRRHGCVRRAAVTAVAAQAIGAEVGFLDGLARLRLTYDRDEPGAPASVIVKVPSSEAAYRRIGDRYHAYQREVRFYGEVAPRSPVRLPRCYYQAMDTQAGTYLLVLEDLGSLVAGDQVKGLTAAQALVAAETMGRFHACWWDEPALEALAWMPWRNIDPARYRQLWPGFREAVGPRLPAPAVELGEKLGARLEGLLAAMEQRPHTIAHSDCRADNLLFGDPCGPDPVVVLDWQLAIRGREESGPEGGPKSDSRQGCPEKRYGGIPVTMSGATSRIVVIRMRWETRPHRKQGSRTPSRRPFVGLGAGAD